jgi:L-ectoine synthase
MFIRTTKEIEGTDRDVSCPKGHFKSLRILLERDNMGFSVHKTLIPKGGPYHWHYKNHLEACYCVEGNGVLTNLSNGDMFEIQKDTIYALDKNDNHTFEAKTDVILISIFNPPITGNEVHQEDGSYINKLNLLEAI